MFRNRLKTGLRGYETDDNSWDLSVKTEIDGDTKGLSLALTVNDKDGQSIASAMGNSVSTENRTKEMSKFL